MPALTANSTKSSTWRSSDNLGTVRDLAEYDDATDTTAIVDHFVYDAFGNETDHTGSNDFLLKYTGRAFDEETGLQNNVNRWFDPAVGRWLSEDPIGFEAGDANVYRYVGNFATGAVDPSGLEEEGGWLDFLGSVLTAMGSSAGSGAPPWGYGQGPPMKPVKVTEEDLLMVALAQIPIDIAGMFDPTPCSDIAGTGAEIIQGNPGQAVLSGAGLFPYIGDTAKIAKLGKYAKTVSRALKLAETSASFRKRAEPILRKISTKVSDALNSGCIPDSMRKSLEQLRSRIDRAIGGQGKAARQQGDRMTSKDNVLDQLEEIEDAQRKVRQGKSNKVIDSIEKSRQRSKNKLKDIANDPDLLDDLD